MSDAILAVTTPLSGLASALAERGHAVLAANDFARFASSPVAELDALRPSWDDLPPDVHLRDGGRYRRRRHASFVVADLTGERPNVYLEVGYAWGLGKPVILLARDGQKLHFDLAHHKCIFYKTIGKLAADLERLVRELYGPG